jgi:DNA-binding winged helix-turn-helix (wHTH) protein
MDVLQLHDRTVNLTTREVHGPTTTGHLTELEVRLLRYLAERPGQAVSRTTLLVDVWGYAPHVRTRTVAAAFKRLRQKLEAPSGPPRHILTVYGEGYRLEGIGAAHHPSPSEPPASRLLDRDQLLQQLRALVARPGVVVGIVGPPGVDASSVLATLATASASPSVIDLRVHSPPTSTESLLLLDHLDEHPQARDILANRSPASSTAYTVLRPLHHPGEVVLQVPPLAPNAARELFRHFLQATRPDPTPGPRSCPGSQTPSTACPAHWRSPPNRLVACPWMPWSTDWTTASAGCVPPARPWAAPCPTASRRLGTLSPTLSVWWPKHSRFSTVPAH